MSRDCPITPATLRAARAALGWSMRDLEAEAGVTRPTIVRIEAGGEASRQVAAKLVRAFRRHGVSMQREKGSVLVRVRVAEDGSPIAPRPVSPADVLHDLPYVTARPRKDGKCRVLFEVPSRLRPPGWSPTVPLSLTGDIGVDLSDPAAVAAVRKNAGALMHRLQAARERALGERSAPTE